MDTNSIKDLICQIDKSNICTFELKMDDFKISLIKDNLKNQKEVNAKVKSKIISKTNLNNSISKLKKNNLTIIRSHLVGVFYNHISNEFDYQVYIGAKVKKGQILGMIMYLNIPMEIKSHLDGKIIKIYIENGEMVEYGQELFGIEV